MAILLPAQADTPLSQGDLLAEIPTTVSVVNGNPLAETGPVLVVSRRCNAIRDSGIIVAPVKKRSLQGLREQETLEDWIAFFTRLRDGDGAPDSFYLGELAANSTERYFAKFDSLRTIQVPVEQGARQEFLRKHRTHHLAEDYIRDMQLRLFRAFASLGFDDSQWWSDSDLKVVVGRGEALLKECDAAREKAASERAGLELAGAKQKDVNAIGNAVVEAEARLKRIQEHLGPLREERARREGAGPERRLG